MNSRKEVIAMELEKKLALEKSSGARWEKQFFGCSASEFEQCAYQGLHRALNEVVRIQHARGWDPINPPTEIGRRLFEAVKSFLSPEDAADLRLYCAIGTALDIYHGADGFFRVRGHVVLIDLTTRLDKMQGKAFIFIRRDRGTRRIGTAAKKIADLLND